MGWLWVCFAIVGAVVDWPMLGPSRTCGVPRAVTMESSLMSKDESPVIVEAVEVDELDLVRTDGKLFERARTQIRRRNLKVKKLYNIVLDQRRERDHLYREHAARIGYYQELERSRNKAHRPAYGAL